MNLQDFFLSLNNIIKNDNINNHSKCIKHPENKIICYNMKLKNIIVLNVID